MDYVGMNPNPANAKGADTATAAADFGSLKGDLMSTVEACIAAAGEPEVMSGFEEFGATWSTDLEKTGLHGESVGGTTHLTVADGVGTDAENAAGQSVDAPAPSAPRIRLV